MADIVIKERADRVTRIEPSWISYIKGRTLKKKNFIMNITGPTGSGKSYTALSIALQLDNEFGPEHIIFGFRNLMKLINSGEKFKPGTVFLWDEFQIEAGARNWQSLTNKLLNSLLSTFRHKNFILIVTSPYQDFIDSQSRKLFHAEFQTQSIDYNKKTCKVKPNLIQYNSRTGKFYYKYLRVRIVRGVAPVTAWHVQCPPEWILTEYERMKNAFTTELNRSIEAQLDGLEAKNTKERDILTELQDKCIRLMAKYKDMPKVATEMGISIRAAYFHLSNAHKKGYTEEEFVENGGKTS